MNDLSLTPMLATTIFVFSCLAGHRYRKVWKEEGPRWQLWGLGIAAAVGLMVLGFIPMKVG